MGFLPRVGDLGKSRLCASEGLGEGRARAGRPMPTARAGDRGHRMALELPGVPPASRPPPLCPPFPETGSEKGSQDLGMILLGLPEVVQWCSGLRNQDRHGAQRWGWREPCGAGHGSPREVITWNSVMGLHPTGPVGVKCLLRGQICG